MDTENWLDEHLHLHTETRIPLESLVVSQEGFIDNIRDLFRKTTGKSMKGGDYKPVRLEHTYNFKATITAISRQYGNPTWLNKQNWVKGKVDGSDIIPYLEVSEPEQLSAVLQEAYAFTHSVHEQWLKAYTSYFNKLKPVVKLVEQGLTDDTLRNGLKLLKTIPPVEKHYSNKPKVFPVGQVKIPAEFAMLKHPDPVKGRKVGALDKTQVEVLVAQLLKDLEVLANYRETFNREAFKVVGNIQRREFLQLCHSRNPKLPTGSKAKLDDWIELATRLDVTRMYWACDEFAVVRRLYGNVVLAACRWIDRSIV